MKVFELALNENNYSAPLVEVIEVEVEKGFATSGSLPQYENIEGGFTNN